MPDQSLQPHGVERFAEVPFLIVEDDPASARLVATMLGTEGASDVRVAHRAEEALAVLRDQFSKMKSGLEFARDLHDQVGQQLTALRLVLERHQAECRVNSRAAIDTALSLAREIDAEIDSLAWELRPGVVDDLGLAPSLRQLVRRWADCAPVDAECHCAIARGQLSREAEVTVYRVAQEALHNVLKHAHATHVKVLCEVRSGAVVLIVQDDGVGCDFLKDGDTTVGMGVRGMRERAALVGGTLQVESARGGGCTVSLRIPEPLAD